LIFNFRLSAGAEKKARPHNWSYLHVWCENLQNCRRIFRCKCLSDMG